MRKKPDPALRYQPRHAWYLADALLVVRDLQAAMWPLQAHVTLGGGVLNHGYSDKDIDIYVLPIYTEEQRPGLTEIVGALYRVLGAPALDYDEIPRSRHQEAGDKTCFAWSAKYRTLRGSVDVFVVRA